MADIKDLRKHLNIVEKFINKRLAEDALEEGDVVPFNKAPVEPTDEEALLEKIYKKYKATLHFIDKNQAAQLAATIFTAQEFNVDQALVQKAVEKHSTTNETAVTEEVVKNWNAEEYLKRFLESKITSVGRGPQMTPHKRDIFIVGANPQGDWIGHEGQMAVYMDKWHFFDIKEISSLGEGSKEEPKKTDSKSGESKLTNVPKDEELKLAKDKFWADQYKEYLSRL